MRLDIYLLKPYAFNKILFAALLMFPNLGV